MQAPPPTFLKKIPSGREGVRETLRMMRLLVRSGKTNPLVRQRTVELVNGLRQKAFADEVKRIFDFVQRQIRYTKDVRGVETLHTADRVLLNRAGDCDDKAILVASMLEAIGHPTRFIAVGFMPGRFSHVFTETRIGDKWIALETPEPQPLGWRPPNIKQAMIIAN